MSRHYRRRRGHVLFKNLPAKAKVKLLERHLTNANARLDRRDAALRQCEEASAAEDTLINAIVEVLRVAGMQQLGKLLETTHQNVWLNARPYRGENA